MSLTRRDAIRQLALGGAAAAAAPLWVEALAAAAGQHAAHYQAASGAAAWTPRVLSPWQDRLVVALAERIIPETDTAGATKARVNRFIDGVLADATPADRQTFLDGLAWLDTRSRRDTGAAFADAALEEQTTLLTSLSTNTTPSPEDRPGVDFFTAIKSLTISGYYTSEIAMREEMGDTGQMFFLEFPGCTHDEHRK